MTAVEWLFEQLDISQGYESANNILEQAKEMEKEQIIDAYESLEHRHGENYYNETFKNSEQ
jgi:hypothetical protein